MSPTRLSLLALVAVATAFPRPLAAQPPPAMPPDPPAPPTDVAGTAGDDAPDGDAAPTEGDAELTEGDAAPTEGDAAPTEGDAALTEDDLALTEDDLALTDEEVAEAAAALGLDEEAPAGGGAMSLREVEVAYAPEDVLRIGGGVSLVDEQQLEAFRYDDPTDVLLGVPGVYVRSEDGFGLRPNIGMRGVAAERSRKITLMEDGVLFGPAPYSAPAAYYFPMMARVVGVEVFKGPSAVLYGPQTVGGSINLLTREVPATSGGSIDASYGRFDTRRFHLAYGVREGRLGLAIEAVHLASAGFKTIDVVDDDTGFSRNEATLTGQWESDPAQEAYHRVELRVGYANELADETYVGLSDADFADDPVRRYVGSQLDRFEWWRTQVRLRHRFELGERFRLVTTAYRHDLDRTWRRAERFRDGTPLFDVVTSPEAHPELFAVLRGDQDSVDEGEQLLLTSNGRRFVSQGVQTVARASFVTGAVDHALEVGLRLHHDRIERDQPLTPYDVRGGILLQAGPSFFGSENVGETLAFAAHVGWGLTFLGFTVTPGARLEVIQGWFEEQLASGGERDEQATQVVALPGLGLTYAITDALAVVAGVHRGFSPVSPGNLTVALDDGGTADREPELSVNYEAGLRYVVPRTETLAEVVGFYNDYSNLIAECAGSSGCPSEEVGRQFGAGRARVFGVEVAAGHRFDVGEVALPTRLAYTFIDASFRDDFRSDFPEWGDVVAGDPIPYVPEHQLRLQAGVAWSWLEANVGLVYVGAMPEDTDGRFETDDHVLLDALVRVRLAEGLHVFVRGENLLNQQPIVSRRPFGARPLQPLFVAGGLTVAIPGL